MVGKTGKLGADRRGVGETCGVSRAGADMVGVSRRGSEATDNAVKIGADRGGEAGMEGNILRVTHSLVSCTRKLVWLTA